MPTDHTPPGLTALQRGVVESRVREDLKRAESLVGRSLPAVPVQFDLRGTAAGMFCSRGGQHWLRFNEWLFARDFETHLADTVPHEVAHYAVHLAFARRRVKPHGAEWQSVMRGLGANPSATFDADLEGLPARRQQRWPYRCACREHAVSTTRHRRMERRRAEYRCRYCEQPLVAANRGSD